MPSEWRRNGVMQTRLSEQLAAIGIPMIVGFEATGNHHRTLARRLLAAGFDLRLNSSVALARTRKALHNGCDKNDPKDARAILNILRRGDPALRQSARGRDRRSPGAFEDAPG
jgi:transposase